MLLVNNLIGFGAGGKGAIQFVGGKIATKAIAASGNTTMSLNSGLTGGIDSAVAAGDMVIAVFALSGYGSARTLDITDGTNNYTLIGSQLYMSTTYADNSIQRVAYKFMGSTPDTSTTFGPTGGYSVGSDSALTAVYVFRGVDTATPLDVTVQQATANNTVKANPPSITPVTGGAFIVCVGSGTHRDGVDTYSSSELTGFISAGVDASRDAIIGIGHKNDWSSGAFDPAQFTFSGTDHSSFSSLATTIALRPA